MKPRLLDLFSGAGGAGMGYYRAGFDVVGVDIAAQKNYPFEFHQADALEFFRNHGDGFDVVHASPPCQPYSTGVTSKSSRWVRSKGKDEPALIDVVHRTLRESGRPYIIENVMGSRAEMPGGWIVLCGSMFGMPISRHRVFTSSHLLLTPPHPSCIGLAKRSSEELGWEYRDMSVTGKGRRAGTGGRWAHLMGIEWPMTQHELAEAIPPAYTEYLGRQLIAVVQRQAA